MANTTENIDKVIHFLEEIGLSVTMTSLEKTCFLPGLEIHQGTLKIDLQKLLYPGDILHEAGHLAVVPAGERLLLSDGNIAQREQREAEEMMAIAWSYAACLHLEIDPGFVFHEEGYKGGGNSIIENFGRGNYFGVPMLQWAGMTNERKNDTQPDLLVYPNMTKWLRS